MCLLATNSHFLLLLLLLFLFLFPFLCMFGIFCLFKTSPKTQTVRLMRRGVGVVERVRTFPKVFSIDPPPVTEDGDFDEDRDGDNDGDGDGDNVKERVDGDDVVVVGAADENGEEAAGENESSGGSGSVGAAGVGSDPVVRRRGKQQGKPVKKRAKKLTAKQIKMEAEALFTASRRRPEQVDASLLALPPCTSWVSLRQNIRAQVRC